MGHETEGARESPDEPVAALRDAAFYNSARFANTGAQPSYIPVYHVVRPDDPHYVSGCGRILVPGTEVLARGVVTRCQRSGCRERWPS